MPQEVSEQQQAELVEAILAGESKCQTCGHWATLRCHAYAKPIEVVGERRDALIDICLECEQDWTFSTSKRRDGRYIAFDEWVYCRQVACGLD